VAGAPDPRPSRASDDASSAERLDFKVAVLALDGRCLVHADQADCAGPLQAHHVLTQQQLRKRGHAGRLWDPANGMTICKHAHDRHTLAAERIALDVVPERCKRFARELDLEYLLERFYP